MSIVYSFGSHFGSSEDVDFPKVLKKRARPGECAEKSVDLHKVVKKTARAAEINVTIVCSEDLWSLLNQITKICS